jgi:hypothetical protein
VDDNVPDYPFCHRLAAVKAKDAIDAVSQTRARKVCSLDIAFVLIDDISILWLGVTGGQEPSLRGS